MHFYDIFGKYFSSYKLCFKFFNFKIFAYFPRCTKIEIYISRKLTNGIFATEEVDKGCLEIVQKPQVVKVA